jgi:hypothetical protein
MKRNGRLSVKELSTGKTAELVFFHYHGLKFFTNDSVLMSEYNLENRGVKSIYFNYIKALVKVKNELDRKIPGINTDAARANYPSLPLNAWEKLKNRAKQWLGKEIYHSVAQVNIFYIKDITG